ncbi:hypothetical protein N9608_03580 [Amylibacter sp.]|nr:hypothetical protein [Amylibacter sp.]
MEKVSILYKKSKRSGAYFSMFPILISKQRKFFDFYTNIDKLMVNDNNQFILLVDFFDNAIASSEDHLIINKLRKKYKRLCYFSTSDGPEIRQGELVNYFDVWFKKQLYKDKSEYLALNGVSLVHNYFGQRQNLDQKFHSDHSPIQNENLKKLKVAWNILIGPYPIKKWKLRIARYTVQYFGTPATRFISRLPEFSKIETKKKNFCQARFNANGYDKTIGYQREIYLKKIKQFPKMFEYDFISQKEYNLEMKTAALTLSPFGWGEICYRDAESFINSSLLIKPDVSHLETWPNIYLNNKTYIPINWDGTDLVEKVNYYLKNQEQLYHIANCGNEKLTIAYQELEDRVSWFQSQISGR